MIGQNLGHFTVLSKLGEGGQGAVYLATDNKLDRKVALKVLSSHALEDESLQRRFILEAKSSASLDHPNICTIYSIEEIEGQTLLAMTYLEGETIRQKVQRGPLPVDQAIDFALQTLKGLETAHREGIVHRDIKSSNLMVVPPGLVKIMDFGLALASDRTRITETNTALGTPAYMSPEQAHGETVDRRTDLWSVGVVLYEMLSGRTPFSGENSHAMLVSILTRDPEPLTGLRTGVPIELDRIVDKALAKDAEERYQHADDFAADLRRLQKELSGVSSGSQETTRLSADTRPTRPGASGRPWIWWLPWAVTCLSVLLLILVARQWLTTQRTSAVESPVVRLSINLPEEHSMNFGLMDSGSVVLSPDGKDLVYVGQSEEGTRLYRQSFETGELTAIPETLGARTPFFSPDSRTLGYLSSNELFESTLRGFGKRVTPVFGRRLGADRAPDGSIYFGPTEMTLKGPVEVLSPGQRTLTPLTKLQSGESQFYEYHAFPQLLPNGKGLLYVSQYREGGTAFLYRFDTSERIPLVEDVIGARFLPSRFLILAALPNQLLAAEFDPDSLRIIGEPVPVLSDVWLGHWGSETWSISATGTLVYVAGVEDQYSTSLAWLDHDGNKEVIVETGQSYLCPRVSPNERYLLAQYDGAKLGVFDLQTHIWSRLTGGAGAEFWATWHPDGETVIFNSDRESRGTVNLFRVKLGGGKPERLTRSEYHHQPHCISSDGKYLLYTEAPVPKTGFDIWALRLDIAEPPTPIFITPANTFHPVLSPDDQWLAYVSDESGRPEVYVQTFPEAKQRTRVSTRGGIEPLWSPDGQTLYFRSAGGQEAFRASFEDASSPRFSSPELMFRRGTDLPVNSFGRFWDISPDGKRFLVFDTEEAVDLTELKVILNWRREVEEKLIKRK